MAAEGLDALVVRAPDNVLYLTDFWPMKGYDACVFPREGEPVLICLEASAAEAAASAWTGELRTLRGRILFGGVEGIGTRNFEFDRGFGKCAEEKRIGNARAKNACENPDQQNFCVIPVEPF